MPASVVGQGGASTTAPDSLAGRWEAETPEGDFVGISLQLSTIVQGRPLTLLGVPEQIESASFSVFYRRRGHDVEPAGAPPLGWNGFELKDSEYVRWDGKHLVLNYGSRDTRLRSPRILLDLLRDAKNDTWTGLFQRYGAHTDVVLERPLRRKDQSVFAGTWRGQPYRCVHIVQARDGTFTAWSDQVRVPGLERYAPRPGVPTSVTEFYGRPIEADLVNAVTLQLDFNGFSAGVFGRFGPVFMRVAQDGWTAHVNGSDNRPEEVWRRQTRNSCLR